MASVVASVVVASCAKTPPVTLPPPLPAAAAPSIGHLIPLPRTVEPAAGPGFTITADTVVVVSPGDGRAMWVANYLADTIGLAAAPQPPRVEIASGAPLPRGSIALELGGVSVTGVEAYELTSGPDGITIRANQPDGLFYGVQSLRQMLPAFVEYSAVRPDPRRPVVAAAGRIVDEPRFAWRGAMLDVARHFLPVDDVKRYIDLMALYKLNRLHLHLADDQGWRIEIKSWPSLAAHGGSTRSAAVRAASTRRPSTRTSSRYAAERFITIVPEIDMPGHTNAALASYAELNCDGVAPPLCTRASRSASARSAWTRTSPTRSSTTSCARSPRSRLAPCFHIGGDEVETLTADAVRPRSSSACRRSSQSHGKRMIGWDEVAAARLLPTSLVQHWRPKASPEAVGEGARSHHVAREQARIST